jgi:hypothetical protein
MSTNEPTHREAAESCGLRLEHYGHAMNCRLYDGERVVFDGHMCDSWDFMRTMPQPPTDSPRQHSPLQHKGDTET